MALLSVGAGGDVADGWVRHGGSPQEWLHRCWCQRANCSRAATATIGRADPVRPVVSRGVVWGGYPKFLGNLDCPFALFSRRRQDRGHQTGTVPRRGPWYVNSKGSYERSFGAQ